MIPFRLSFEPGISLYEQVVYAAKKAMISGQMRPGDPFPSVRALSKALKINPNTAHKVVTQLVAEGLIEVRPGLGTVVAELPASTAAERGTLLKKEAGAAGGGSQEARPGSRRSYRCRRAALEPAGRRVRADSHTEGRMSDIISAPSIWPSAFATSACSTV